MKPHIWFVEGAWYCAVPYMTSVACGRGARPVGAYTSWLHKVPGEGV